ncbi:MAG: hypothetical protein RR346_05955 [Bacteroidales bacterium]
MASIKFLKKEISSMADELAMACLLSKAEITDTDVPKVNAILAEIYNFEAGYREKAHLYAHGKDAKEIRKYYNALYNEIQEKAQSIVEQIKTLN